MFRVCNRSSYLPFIPCCGSEFETEQDLVDAYNSVCYPEGIVTKATYILFCPYCKNYFDADGNRRKVI